MGNHNLSYTYIDCQCGQYPLHFALYTLLPQWKLRGLWSVYEDLDLLYKERNFFVVVNFVVARMIQVFFHYVTGCA